MRRCSCATFGRSDSMGAFSSRQAADLASEGLSHGQSKAFKQLPTAQTHRIPTPKSHHAHTSGKSSTTSTDIESYTYQTLTQHAPCLQAGNESPSQPSTQPLLPPEYALQMEKAKHEVSGRLNRSHSIWNVTKSCGNKKQHKYHTMHHMMRAGYHHNTAQRLQPLRRCGGSLVQVLS